MLIIMKKITILISMLLMADSLLHFFTNQAQERAYLLNLLC